MAERLKGKTAIVTGASQGIGAAITRRLVIDGATVVGVARGEEAGAALEQELPGKVAFVFADLCEGTTPLKAVQLAQERFGGVDILVNNAARDWTGSLLDASLDELRDALELNVVAATGMLQVAARSMVASGGGSIVNVTSRLASIGVPTMSFYSATKGALLALTRAAAVELAPHGVRVNAVAPGLTSTPLMVRWLAEQEDPQAIEAAHLAAIPQGRFGSPQEVASVVAFLASEDAAHMTGASLAVDGGYTAT